MTDTEQLVTLPAWPGWPIAQLMPSRRKRGEEPRGTMIAALYLLAAMPWK
jgi:hypothetical protein